MWCWYFGVVRVLCVVLVLWCCEGAVCGVGALVWRWYFGVAWVLCVVRHGFYVW